VLRKIGESAFGERSGETHFIPSAQTQSNEWRWKIQMGWVGLRIDSAELFTCEDLPALDPRAIRGCTADICAIARVPMTSTRSRPHGNGAGNRVRGARHHKYMPLASARILRSKTKASRNCSIPAQAAESHERESPLCTQSSSRCSNARRMSRGNSMRKSHRASRDKVIRIASS
jgi:hypothetical protein